MRVTLPALLWSASSLSAQSADVAARVARIERGLLPQVQVSGLPDTGQSLLARMRLHRVPGVSIAFIDSGRVAWARGYGFLENGSPRPVDTATVFLAGSISKPVAATAALRLVQQGKLALDEDVNLKLASWKVPDNEFTQQEKVTLRRLLSHSAGLTVHGFPGYANGLTLPTVVQVLNGESPANTPPVRVDVKPGSIWRYSGGGYTVAQLLMTDVTGKPFPRLMQELVLVPLGMTRSTYENPLPPGRMLNAASGHERADAPVRGRWHVYPEMAAAGLWTTPSDLSRWIIDIMNGYRGGDVARTLPSTLARDMLTLQKGQWGLGVQLRGAGDSLSFEHGGRDEGFTAQFIAWPARRQGIVIMTNGTSGALIRELQDAIAREYGLPVSRRQTVAAGVTDTTELRSFAGRYRRIANGDTLSALVSVKDGRLWISTTNDVLFPAVAIGGGTPAFITPDNGARFVFARATGGGPSPEITVTWGGTVTLRRVY